MGITHLRMRRESRLREGQNSAGYPVRDGNWDRLARISTRAFRLIHSLAESNPER